MLSQVATILVLKYRYSKEKKCTLTVGVLQSSVKIITYCRKYNHVRLFFRYCIVVFDGDQYKMSHGINYTPAGGTSQPFATPFKKYYNSEDYVSCIHGQECSIYIKNQKMVTVKCYPRGAIDLWVINMVMLIVFLWFITAPYWC